MRTELGRIATLLQTAHDEGTPLQQRLDQVGRRLLVACVGIVAIVALLGFLRDVAPFELLLSGVSLAVAVIGLQAWPEAQDRRQMQMAADLRMLQEQTQQLQTLLQTLTEAVKQIDARVTQRIDQQDQCFGLIDH